MAAPTTTARPASEAAIGGIKVPNGWQSIIVFNRLATAYFYTIGLTPGKIDGGEPINTSTMLNPGLQTKAPRELREEGDSVAEAAYDPYLREQIRNTLINEPGSVTEHFPDGSKEDYYGFLRGADFSKLEDGALPMVTLTIVKTNYDPVNRVVVAPVFTNVTGS